MKLKKFTIGLSILSLSFMSVPAASAASAITLQIKVMGEDKKSFNWNLKCQPNSGSHPQISTACKFLNTATGKKAMLEPPKKDMCTQIYGGDITARISGTFKGKKVNLSLNRKDGCKIAQWDSLIKVLVKR
jgi:hypothetical protein